MITKTATAGLAGLAFLALSAGSASAAAFSPAAQTDRSVAVAADGLFEQAQFRGYGRGYGPGPRFYGPRGYYGRPYWFSRPWGARPYYGTIIAGVALGTLITVAAVGYAPPRPRPDLCWYWTDPSATRGYWDYCGRY
jgi:hypothetical protein